LSGAGRERDEVAGIVEIAEKIPGGELIPGELGRQARTILGVRHAGEQRDTREERVDAPPSFHNAFSFMKTRTTLATNSRCRRPAPRNFHFHVLEIVYPRRVGFGVFFGVGR
jgi:hypothetical protein